MNVFSLATSRTSFTFAFVFVIGVATPGFAQQSMTTHNGRRAMESEVLIRLSDASTGRLERAKRIVNSAQFEALSPSLGLHRVKVSGRNLPTLLQAFSSNPDVLFVEPNYVWEASNVADDPLFSLLWGMSQISAPAGWDIATGGTSAAIGVVDSGVDYTHPDLAANIWSAPAAFTVTIAGNVITCPEGTHGFNAINMTCDPMDDSNHGTHVAGTIGAVGSNGGGLAGVNWRAQILGLKFLSANGLGSTSAAINAIEFALQVKERFQGTPTPVNLRVLSASWSGNAFSSSLLAQINKANSRDVLFVAAAGNAGNNNDATPVYPAGYTAPNIISVAASDRSDALASFSNYGESSVHLSAPGVGIYSTIRRSGYASLSGTSMAAPHVAGAALLTLAACPSLNTAALKAAILASADPITSLAGKTITGGRLNVNRTIRSCSAASPAAVTKSIDFNGDAKPDLVWQNAANGEIGVWLMNRNVTESTTYFVPGQYPDTSWQIAGVGDFNADAKPDLVWQQVISGEVGVWFMDGIARTSASYFVPGRVSDAQWQIAAVDDFNNDGRSDLFWQHQGTGQVGVWFMNGTTLTFSTSTTPAQETDPRWKVVAAGDFNQDSRSDLVWQRSDNGDIKVWFMDAYTRIAEGSIHRAPNSDSNWKVVGAGDFNSDGRPDLILRHAATGQIGTWSTDGNQLAFNAFFSPGAVTDLNWRIRNR